MSLPLTLYIAFMEQSTDRTSSVNFRTYLQEELVKRCRANPRYSLRAFAKSLGIAHATLSALLSGKRPFTKNTILRISQSLNLSPKESQYFVQQALLDIFQEQVNEKIYLEFTMDNFLATSEWYYDAILELTKTKKFKSNVKWISQALNLTQAEVKLAVERLQRLGLLSIDDSGRWTDLVPNASTIINNDFTNSALRKYQKQILELSAKSIDEVDIDLRDHTSMTLAIRVEDLPFVKEKIKKFRRQITACLEKTEKTPDQVYQIAISFFPLSRA